MLLARRRCSRVAKCGPTDACWYRPTASLRAASWPAPDAHHVRHRERVMPLSPFSPRFRAEGHSQQPI